MTCAPKLFAASIELDKMSLEGQKELEVDIVTISFREAPKSK